MAEKKAARVLRVERSVEVPGVGSLESGQYIEDAGSDLAATLVEAGYLVEVSRDARS